MKFIGHLDLLKVFQRAIKRAELPIAYSKGFNPHQLMSFAVPLPLGTESIGEYVDIQFKEEFDTDKIINSLNNVMPDGLHILNAVVITDETKNGAADIEAAEYEIELCDSIDNIESVINNLINSNELMIEKTSKRKTKLVNIREDIYDIVNISDNQNTKLKAVISAGSKKNLKPSLLIEYLYKSIDKEYTPFKIKYKRIDLFSISNGELKSLLLM